MTQETFHCSKLAGTGNKMRRNEANGDILKRVKMPGMDWIYSFSWNVKTRINYRKFILDFIWSSSFDE